MLVNRILIISLIAIIMLSSCKKDEDIHEASLILKTGALYTKDGANIKLGGIIKIGVLASGAGVPLTYLKIERINSTDTLVEVDRGIYKESEGLDEDFTFSKDTSSSETWRVTVMNADRDTSIRTLKINRAPGSEWRPIKHFEDIELAMQANQSSNWFLDLDYGIVFNNETVILNEYSVDIMAYFYITSGLPSPTLACPGYTSAIAYYPNVNSWPVKNNTLFDYLSADNDLISEESFDMADNDSLLVASYKADKVSGNCKFCYTGKIIPFKTANGKYGLIKVIEAQQNIEGSIRISVKIQE